MKKFIFLLSFSILFQSCFSYKTVDYNNIVIGGKQKFEILGVGGTNIKGRRTYLWAGIGLLTIGLLIESDL
jgi:hypothetical protein